MGEVAYSSRIREALIAGQIESVNQCWVGIVFMVQFSREENGAFDWLSTTIWIGICRPAYGVCGSG